MKINPLIEPLPPIRQLRDECELYREPYHNDKYEWVLQYADGTPYTRWSLLTWTKRERELFKKKELLIFLKPRPQLHKIGEVHLYQGVQPLPELPEGAQIALYGSRIAGYSLPDSDIDIMYEGCTLEQCKAFVHEVLLIKPLLVISF